jgi:hypothetical protein
LVDVAAIGEKIVSSDIGWYGRAGRAARVTGQEQCDEKGVVGRGRVVVRGVRERLMVCGRLESQG